MLIEFSVSNFRSIREKQTLSMVASSRDDSLPENLIRVSLPGLSNTAFLKTVVLYGANASGKSNLLKAIDFMDGLVEHSATRLKPGEPIDFEPFRFDTDSANKPSEFEMMFVAEGIRYQYGLSVDRTRVHQEWLYAYPNGVAQRWFERSLEADGTYSWEFSQKHFKGSREVLTRQTRDNALFLSTAAQFNHEQLLPAYGWFRNRLLNLDLSKSSKSALLFTESFMRDHRDRRSSVLRLLENADLGISDIVQKEEEFDLGPNWMNLPPNLPELKRIVTRHKGEGELKAKLQSTEFLHRVPGRDEAVVFDSRSESAGTLRYFAVLGPWLDVFQNGKTLVVDELGANIHPLLVRALLKTAQSERENPYGAQVILTTHDVTLLDREIFRRDQVWFTEKDANAATRLYPLTDYQPRKDEALARGYLAGRYGAIPFLTGELSL